MSNPFPNRKSWQDAKKKHGIPDNLIGKGSFGAHLDDLRKRYDTYKLDKVTPATAKAAKLLSSDTRQIIATWRAGAAPKKAKFKDYAGADKILDTIELHMKALDQRIVVALNPLAGAKGFFDAGANKVKAAIAAPTDHRKLETAYREGVRNDIGQRMRAALKHSDDDKKAYPSNVVALLKQYDALVQKWGSRIDDGEAKDILASDKDRTACFKDMTDAVKISKQVLKLAG
jgi:hypothetical protein